MNEQNMSNSPAIPCKSDKIIRDLKRLAKRYGVEKNELFLTAASQYALQQQVISMIRAQIDEDALLTTKEYVKGRENICVNPLVKELPKHAEAANKTASTMLNIIKECGNKNKAQTDRLTDLVADLEKNL